MSWRMLSSKSEPFFKEQALDLFNKGKDVDYIANLLNTDNDTVWRWIRDDRKADLYVDFNNIWRLVQVNYFCQDFQDLANSIGKRIKIILKKNKREEVYEPKTE